MKKGKNTEKDFVCGAEEHFTIIVFFDADCRCDKELRKGKTLAAQAIASIIK